MRISQLPEREILLAAKVGFLTKRLWLEFMVIESSKSWRNERWRKLVTDGFFKPHPSALATDTIVLDLRNPYVRNTLRTRVARAPFVSQLTHDELVVRSLLQLSRSQTIRFFKTEIELKSQEMAAGLSHSRANDLKFPDAIIDLRSHEPMKVALEMELSIKSPERYRQILLAYLFREDVSHVVYVTKTSEVTAALRRAMDALSYASHSKPIGIVPLIKWSLDPAKAAIQFEDESSTLEQLCTGEAS